MVTSQKSKYLWCAFGLFFFLLRLCPLKKGDGERKTFLSRQILNIHPSLNYWIFRFTFIFVSLVRDGSERAFQRCNIWVILCFKCTSMYIRGNKGGKHQISRSHIKHPPCACLAWPDRNVHAHVHNRTDCADKLSVSQTFLVLSGLSDL